MCLCLSSLYMCVVWRKDEVGFRVFVLNGSGEVKDTIVVRIGRQRNGCA
jgi:hypothetical protein